MHINIGKPILMLVIIVSALTSCTTTNNRQGNYRGGQVAHFSQKPEINKDGEIKQTVVRKPNLQKLKIFTPNIVKAQDSNKEKAKRMKQIAKNITDSVPHIKEDINFKKDAELIEEEKSYNRFDTIMVWIAVLSSCALIWCSVWFVGRSLLK